MLDKKRIESIGFHIKLDDYSGTLATILDLRKQTLVKNRDILNNEIEILESLKNDLIFLQKNNKIITK